MRVMVDDVRAKYKDKYWLFSTCQLLVTFPLVCKPRVVFGLIFDVFNITKTRQTTMLRETNQMSNLAVAEVQ